MKKLFPILFIFGCTTSSIVVQPIKPIPSPIQPVADTVIKTIHDTTVIYKDTLIVKNIITSPDTGTIYLSPLVDDNYDQLQSAFYYHISHPNTKVKLRAGRFPYSAPLVLLSIVNGVYQQISFDIEGAQNAKNTPDQYCSILAPMFTDGPAIAIQLAKGASFKNIKIEGKFLLPDQLNTIQIDTLPIAKWNDGVCRDNPTSPYCGIAVDPFSDPSGYNNYYQMYPTLTGYYLSGMSRSGSTAVTFEGLCIKHFVVDFIVSPSNQQNGEIIHLRHSQLESAKVGYAMTQAQSKQCEVSDIETWMPVHTLFDNLSYGFPHGDGSNAPFIDGVNIANNVHQIFNILNRSFPLAFRNIYGEGIYKIGRVVSDAGGEISGMQVDFQNNTFGFPSPDFYAMFGNILCLNCMMRLYPPVINKSRIAIENYGNGVNTFIGGSTNLAYFSRGQNLSINVKSYDANGVFNNNYDSASWSDITYLKIDSTNFTGVMYQHGSGTNRRGNANVGDIVFVQSPFDDQFNSLIGDRLIGYISKVTTDSIYLSNCSNTRSGNCSIGAYTLKTNVQ